MRGIFLSFVVIVTAVQVRAQSTGSATSTVPVPESQVEAPAKPWTISAEVSTSTNLYDSSVAAGGSRENAYVLSPSLKLGTDVTVFARGQFTHNLIQERASDFENTTIGARVTPVTIVPDVLRLKPSASVLIPTNTREREDKSLRSALGIGSGLEASFRVWGREATAEYALGLRRNVHEFVRDDQGVFNNEYRVVNGITLGLGITEKLSVSVLNRLISNVAYSGTIRSSFEASQSVAYQLNPSLAARVGHSNGGSTLRSDGRTSNVRLVDENTSSFSVGLEAVY